MNKIWRVIIGSFVGLLVFVLPNIVAASPSNTLVIYEIKISGANSYDEYVSIKNVSQNTINLKGYTIARKSANATDYNNLIIFDGGILEPSEVIKVAHKSYIGEDIPDYYYTTQSSITASNAIVIKSPEKVIIDLFGYGNSISFETKAAPEILVNEVYQRIGGDTDNNFNDFQLLKEEYQYDLNLNRILITEIFSAPESGQSEWFEIFNPTSQPINLYGLKVCDGAGSTRCYSFAKNELIAPFAYLTYEQKITKITLNNSGDWLELYDQNDNLIQATENYGSSTTGESFSLFGSTWEWSTTPTKLLKNIFTQLPDEPAKKKKTTVKKPKATKTTKKTVSDKSVEEELVEEIDSVKGAETASPKAKSEKIKISGKNLGYSVILLAVLLFCGYILWEKREKLSAIYHKFKSRNN